MTEDDINYLLRVAGIKPGDLWGTRPQTKLEALKGTKYVNRRGHLTRDGQVELARRKEHARHTPYLDGSN